MAQSSEHTRPDKPEWQIRSRKEKAMKSKMTSKNSEKISLTERVRQITSAAVIAGSLLIGASAQASTRPSSVVDRALAVKGALKEKIATDANASSKFSRGEILLAQWGNGWANAWSNWNNWDNWHNWNNWGNFGNWMNW
jgi:hypothetical protein